METEKATLFGVEVDAMYDGYVALEVIALVKVLDAEGEERWVTRTSEGISDPERYGILTFEAKRIEDYQVRSFERDDDEDEP